MYIEYGQLVFMVFATLVAIGMIIILGASNYMLAKQNKFLRERLRAWRKSCWSSHTAKPF